MTFIEEDGRGSCLDMRNALVNYLQKNEVPFSVATKAMSQCLGVLQDVNKIQAAASELGLEVSGFRTEDKLALYWDVSRDGKEFGYIYRGWDDPGFGIGECVPVSAEDMPVFMAQAVGIANFLATNGICWTVDELTDGSCCLNLTTPIYADGFNPRTFEAVLGTLAECSTMVKSLVGAES